MSLVLEKKWVLLLKFYRLPFATTIIAIQAILANKLSEYKQYQSTYHIPATKLHIIENHRIGFLFLLLFSLLVTIEKIFVISFIHHQEYTLISFLPSMFSFLHRRFHSHSHFLFFYFFNFLTFLWWMFKLNAFHYTHLHTLYSLLYFNKLCNFVK